MKKTKDGQAIQNNILKKCSCYVIIVLVLSLIYIGVSFLIEFINPIKIQIYDAIGEICKCCGPWLYDMALAFKMQLAASLDTLADVTLTYLTIMM